VKEGAGVPLSSSKIVREAKYNQEPIRNAGKFSQNHPGPIG
jgi:hypothetical protein